MDSVYSMTSECQGKCKSINVFFFSTKRVKVEEQRSERVSRCEGDKNLPERTWEGWMPHQPQPLKFNRSSTNHNIGTLPPSFPLAFARNITVCMLEIWINAFFHLVAPCDPVAQWARTSMDCVQFELGAFLARWSIPIRCLMDHRDVHVTRRGPRMTHQQ